MLLGLVDRVLVPGRARQTDLIGTGAFA